MSEPLIHQLAERLGCSPEAAEAALRQLVSQVHHQLKQVGQATLPGLGRLIRSAEGLRFEADASLSQAVNHRFAGLEPVTVEPPSAQTYRKTELVPPEESTEGAKAEEAPAVPPFYEATPPEKQPPSREPETSIKAESESEQFATAEPEEPASPVSSERSLKAPRPPRIRVEEARRRGLAVWIPATLLIVVLGAVAIWFLIFSRPAAPEIEPPALSPSEEERATPLDTTATALPADTATQATITPPTIPSAAGNYTLIVGSVTSQAAAQQIAERFRRTLAEQGLSVTIVATSNGTIRYRIAVGRYTSPEEALAAKRQLGQALPPDAWVLRLPSPTQ